MHPDFLSFSSIKIRRVDCGNEHESFLEGNGICHRAAGGQSLNEAAFARPLGWQI